MPEIKLLTKETIDKIAAGEVVDRPSSVVKELVENAIDAGATAVTVEIKDGGTSLIRITDNGCGIAQDQVRIAFLRHSTSKIRSIEDLLSVSSLGFRGEALSSISAVSRVELVTKTRDSLTGSRYIIEGGEEKDLEEIGAPDGTTFLVRDLFYNTPARRKFLKTPQTEGNYISDIVEKLALSHPEVSFKYIQNNQTKLHTSGNGNRRDLIYHVFGRDITASLLPVDLSNEYFSVSGFIGKPVVTRGNRNYENYFINGRFVRSSLLAKGIEDAYKNYLMQHQYPFTVLYFTFHGNDLDVNVHPSKMELRFGNNQEIYQALTEGLRQVLAHKDMIPEVPLAEEEKKPARRPVLTEAIPEPFEKRRLADLRKQVAADSPYQVRYPERRREPAVSLPHPQDETPAAISSDRRPAADPALQKPQVFYLNEGKKPYQAKPKEDPLDLLFGKTPADTKEKSQRAAAEKPEVPETPPADGAYENLTLAQLSPEFLTPEARKKHRIIGQVFRTYWIVEYEDKMFIIDQHAAHEKVLYERTMKRLKNMESFSQAISPPIILTLDPRESSVLEKYADQFHRVGYEVEHFGGKEYMISQVPANLFSVDSKDLFLEMLDDFADMNGKETPDLILEKIASMSCKAAVKGNHTLSLAEVDELIDELLTLDNPFHCPHGRPTIISMTKYELEKKFKRIV